MTTAAKTRIEPGQHSIDRVEPRQDGAAWLLDWSVRLTDGRLVRKRTQAPTKAEVRRRAKVTATELLTTGPNAMWKTTSSLGDYLTTVSRPAIEKANLRENSRRRYLLVLALLGGTCSTHKHTDSLKGHSIGSGTRFRALEACLQEIARLHGSESARQARTVLSKYVLQQLVRDGLATGNPLSGMSIDLASPKTATVTRGGQALSRADYTAVLDHLLALDPADGVSKPKRGRWTLEDRIAQRRNIIDLTLLQATTGMRVTEANLTPWAEVSTVQDGTVYVTVTPEVSKTHRGRRVPILDERVAARILARRGSAAAEAFVIGSPSDPSAVWDRDNCRKTAAAFYDELATVLSIPLLATVRGRTHVWRATLNSLLLNTVPEVTRSAYFGHDASVNRSNYTDLTDVSGMLAAAADLRIA